MIPCSEPRARLATPTPKPKTRPNPNPDQVEHSHVAVIMIDASRGLVQQDKAIADKVCKQAKSCILVGNKSDLLTDKEWEAFRLKVETDLRMIPC